VPHFNALASTGDAAGNTYVIVGSEKTASNQLNAMMHRFVGGRQHKKGARMAPFVTLTLESC